MGKIIEKNWKISHWVKPYDRLAILLLTQWKVQLIIYFKKNKIIYKTKYIWNMMRFYNLAQDFSTSASLKYLVKQFFAVRNSPIHCRMFFNQHLWFLPQVLVVLFPLSWLLTFFMYISVHLGQNPTSWNPMS